MGFDVTETLEVALGRLFTRNGLILLATLSILAFVGTVAQSVLLLEWLESMWDEVLELYPVFEEELEMEPEDFVPVTVEMSTSVAIALAIVSYVGQLGVLVVAIRVFYADLRDELPAEIVFDRAAWVLVNMIVGTIVFSLLWSVGLLLLVVPGIIVFTFLIYYLAAIAVEDRNFVGAMRRSVGVTSGHRFDVFLLFLGVFLVAIAVSIASGLVSSFLTLIHPLVATAVDTLVTSAVVLYFAAVLAISYRALVETPDDPDDEDDPFEDFTPADQKAHW